MRVTYLSDIEFVMIGIPPGTCWGLTIPGLCWVLIMVIIPLVPGILMFGGCWNLNPCVGALWPPSFSLGIGGRAGLWGWPPATLSKGGGPGLGEGAPRSVLTLRPPPWGTSCCFSLAGTRVMLTTAGISSRGSPEPGTSWPPEAGTMMGICGGSSSSSKCSLSRWSPLRGCAASPAILVTASTPATTWWRFHWSSALFIDSWPGSSWQLGWQCSSVHSCNLKQTAASRHIATSRTHPHRPDPRAQPGLLSYQSPDTSQSTKYIDKSRRRAQLKNFQICREKTDQELNLCTFGQLPIFHQML